MDLGSGRTKLVGAARDAQSLTPPAVSPRAVLWLEYTGSTRQRTLVYAYDFSEHRRQRLLETSASLDTPAVAGATGYWLRGSGSATAVVACDIASDRKRVLATGSGLGPFLLADGSLVVWSHESQPAAPFALTVLDTAAGTTTDLALPGQTPGAIFDEPVLAGGTLVWLRIDKQQRAATISTYDLRTLAGRQIAAGTWLVAPGFDGATVVWAQPATGGGGYVVMGQRLAGGDTFRVAAWPPGCSVMVSGDTVAWWMRTGSQSWIETARMPQ